MSGTLRREVGLDGLNHQIYREILDGVKNVEALILGRRPRAWNVKPSRKHGDVSFHRILGRYRDEEPSSLSEGPLKDR